MHEAGEAGEAIMKGEFPGYFKRRFQWWYPEGVYPEWAVGALRGVEVDLYEK